MRGMIVQSGNDAACALAEHIAGTQEDFASLMNDYAQRMELRNTNFTNPTGLPNVNHYSTAEDIAKLSKLSPDLIIPVSKSLLAAIPGVDTEPSSKVRVPSSCKSSTHALFDEFLIFNIPAEVSAHH